jgi:UDP-glucose 4-epimerase
MRTLVTGGAGFIGSTLVDRLMAEGHEVDVVDDLSTGSLGNLAEARADRTRRFTFHRMDIRSPALVDLIAQRRPQVVFHLAAQADVRVSVAKPTFDAEVNILGSINVCQGALAAGTRKVVYAASGGTLYGVAEEIPTREGHPHAPVSPYGISKKAVIDYLRFYRGVHGLEFTACALANVYGPRQDPDGEAGVVAIFARFMLARESPTIFGTGAQTRDFVYVDDVVDAFVRAMDRGDGLLCNIGTGTETTVNQLYAAMAHAAEHVGEPRRAPARAGEIERSSLDPGRAAIHLGWQSWTTLDDGVAQTLDWFRARR